MIEYNDKNMQDALIKISFFDSNYGGTIIYEPLLAAINLLNNFVNDQCHVFVLTDGAVGQIDPIVDLARLHAGNVKVHTFGVGKGASTDLVNRLAFAAEGSATFVAEGDNMNSKVISSLDNAMRAVLKDAKVEYHEAHVAHQAPFKPSRAQKNKAFTSFAILDLKNKPIENLSVVFSFKDPRNFDETMTKILTFQDFQQLEDGELLFKLAAKKLVD